MPNVMFTPEALVRVNGPWVEMLEAAGFRVDYPEDSTFTRGLCGQAETIRVLAEADALIAGAEFLTAEVLAELPKLRVIARAGVGYDRVDVAAATLPRAIACKTRGIPWGVPSRQTHRGQTASDCLPHADTTADFPPRTHLDRRRRAPPSLP